MAPLFTAFTLFSLALAQTTTITLPFPGYEDTILHASVISAKPDATVLALACPPSTTGDCGLFPQQILTYGPSTYVMDMSEPGDDDFTMTQDCSIGVTKAVCKESASGGEANFPGSSTETYEGDGWTGITSLPVTITAGAEKLAASADATPTPAGSSKESTGAAASTGPAASTGNSANSSLAMSTQSTTTSGSSSSSAAPAEHTGAAVRSMASNVSLVGAAAGLFAGLLM